MDMKQPIQIIAAKRAVNVLRTMDSCVVNFIIVTSILFLMVNNTLQNITNLFKYMKPYGFVSQTSKSLCRKAYRFLVVKPAMILIIFINEKLRIFTVTNRR